MNQELLSDPRLNKAFVLHTDDLEVFSRMPEVHALVTFSPYIYEHIRAYSKDIRVIYPLDATSTTDTLLDDSVREAQQAALLLSSCVSRVANAPHIDYWQWDFYNYLHSYIRRWSEIARNFSRLAPKGKFFIPAIQNYAWRYGYHSAVPSLALRAELGKELNIEEISYRQDTSRHLPGLPLSLAGQGESETVSLAYLPATSTHVDLVQGMLDKSTITIQSAYYHTRYRSDMEIGLQRVSNSERANIIREFSRAGINLSSLFHEICDYLLGDVPFGKAIVRQQSSLFCSDFVYQVILWRFLSRSFSVSSLSKILISGHFTPFHGPIISLAGVLGCNVTVVPHSYHQNNPFPPLPNLKFLSDPSQNYYWDRFSREWVRTLPFGRESEQACIEKSGLSSGWSLKRVTLVLNGMCHTHTCFTDMRLYLDGLASIIHHCASKNIEVLIRPKPSENCSALVVDSLPGVNGYFKLSTSKTLEEDLREADLVILYDWPSSAGVQALRLGRPLVACAHTTLNNNLIGVFDRLLVARMSVLELLAKIDTWVVNSEQFTSFFVRQRLNFSASVAISQDTR
jgi:hypothetical protein